MLNKVLDLVRRYEMLVPGDRVVCAVSGGADSMALLWAMYLLQDKLGITVAAAHFNHRLRGEESDRDEEFVRRFCDFHRIPLQVGSETVVAGDKGLEAAARDARYGFFRTLSGKIATAHTADDNAETVVMHLIRGTGLKGLGAIAPVNGCLIRPMLTVTRQEVEAFLRDNHIAWVCDSTNDTDAFLRNRIRHNVMPLLRQENPRLAENLSAMAMELRQDAQALQQEDTLPDIAVLRQMDSARRSRLLRAFLQRSGVKEPDRRHTALAERLVFSGNPSAKASFPGGITVRRVYDRLEADAEKPPLDTVVLNCPGVTQIPALGMCVTCKPAQQVVSEKTVFTVSPQGNLLLRCRQEGDRITLSGGTKSLKRLFIDKKIPQCDRMQIPVLADDAGIVGIYGIGVNKERLSPGIQICFEKIYTTDKEVEKMENSIQSVLLTQEQIQAKVKELAAQLKAEYADKDPVFVGVLKGVVVFFSDMIKEMDFPCQIDFMWVSSYSGTNSSGNMVLVKDVSADLEGRHVVILEDIFDTGNSLEFTYRHLMTKKPASLKICTLLDKPERRRPGVTIKPDYTGFVIPNEFVVGYGLDYNEHYRNLPYVGILKPETYQK